MDDWYQVKVNEFNVHHGATLMDQFNKSPRLAVMDAYPKHRWLEWKFGRLPSSFWSTKSNRMRYFKWLGSELGFRRRDWQKLKKGDLYRNHGHGLLRGYYQRDLAKVIDEIQSA